MGGGNASSEAKLGVNVHTAHNGAVAPLGAQARELVSEVSVRVAFTK